MHARRKLAFTLAALLTAGCRPGNIWVVDGPEAQDGGTGRTPGPRLDAGTDAPRPDGSTSSGGADAAGEKEVTVRLIAPERGAALTGEAALEAEASGPVVRVELFADDALLGAAEAPPYSITWDTRQAADGPHALYAEAIDAAGDRTRSEVVTVVVDNGFRETFSNGATDQEGWALGELSVDAAQDHTGEAGSAALFGNLTTTELTTLTGAAELTVTLGADPGELSFFRKLDIGGDGFLYSGAFRVLVDGQVLEEAAATNQPLLDADWTAVEGIDLSGFAARDVTIRFELTVTNWSFAQAAHATLYLDDLEIRGAGNPPPPPPPPGGGVYPHASEGASELAEVLNLTGRYGVVAAGGHLIASNAAGGSALPRETPVPSTASIQIPAGATVRHALLWYTGVIFMRPHSGGEGDYTSDVGGPLDDAGQVASNGITFAIDGQSFGPFDSAARTPPNPSSLGNDSVISPRSYAPSFGTLTGVKESVWGNRLDVTGIFANRTGTIELEVEPPEKLDVNGNDAQNNGGNPAGNTTYNLCTSGASWSLLVVYEKSDLPEKNLVLLDGAWARAWDYMFFHSGEWIRPKVRIDHAPITEGARFIVYAGSGAPSGGPIPQSPACSCGCGGQYTLKNASSPLGRNNYFSDQHEDPPQTTSDPMHRDRTNGPWYLHSTGAQGQAGNDWTLFQSGSRFTEFPNLFEGEETPSADGVEPVTREDDPDPSGDVYGGHPWAGRGAVTYLAHGNAMSVVEVVPEAARLTHGATTSYLYFKGDQKDVWKPQAVVSVKYVLFETPTGN